MRYKFVNNASGKEYIFEDENFDNRLIFSGEVRSFRTTLSLPDNMEKGEYALSMGLFEKETPIKLAIKDVLKEKDGYYRVFETKIL